MNKIEVIKYILKEFKYMELNKDEVEKIVDEISNIDNSNLVYKVSTYYYSIIKDSILNNNYKYVINYINSISMDSNTLYGKVLVIEQLYELFQICNIDLDNDIYFKIINDCTALKNILNTLNNNIEEVKELEVDSTIIDLIELFNIINEEDFNMVKIYLKDISQDDILSCEQQNKYACIYYETKDKSARDKLLKSNLKLVVSIAKKYVGHGIELMDLIQEGNEGLLEAVNRFDPNKKVKFSTYASYWIKNSILSKFDAKSKSIKLPQHFHENLSILNRYIDNLSKELGRKPSITEIVQRTGFTNQKVQQLLLYSPNILSLNTKIDASGDSQAELMDIIKDEETPESLLFEKVEKEYIYECLDSLDEKESMVLKLRFGFVNDTCYKLEEVSKILFEFKLTQTIVSKERIRQIENNAKRKLKCIIENKNKYYKLVKVN